MASEDKNKRITDSYIKRLKDSKSTFEVRKSFLAGWSIPKGGKANGKKKEEEDEEQDSGDDKDSGNAVPDSGGSDNVYNDKNGIIALAKTKMKAPYVWGAAGPNTFDCSGFVHWLYNQCGYSFGRTNSATMFSQYEKIDTPETADLLFFNYGNGIAHVALWIGNNEFIHTANERHGVQISELKGYWADNFAGYRRVPKSYFKGESSSTSSTNESRARTSDDEMSPLQFFAENTLYKVGDEPVYPPKEDVGYYVSKHARAYRYVAIQFKGNRIKQSKMNRADFLSQRVYWGRSGQYSKYVSLNKKRFIHQPIYDGYEGNLYSPDAKRFFENLLLKCKKPYFEVVSGFRFSNVGQLSPHEAGCAMDIRIRSEEEGREIADCAFQLGARTIALGGNVKDGKGFIHIDIAPKGNDFQYEDTPLYGGPGKWVLA